MADDTVWGKGGGAPDIPADVPVTPGPADVPPAPTPEPARPEFKGLPVRAEGDKVFLLKGGKRYWITSPEIFSKLGFKFGDEVKLDQATLNIIPEGDPLR